MPAVIVILAVLALFLAVILIRACRFKPPKAAPGSPADNIHADAGRAAEILSAMIRIKTVSYLDPDRQDHEEFQKFRALLRESFPLVNERCRLELIGYSGVLYHLKGTQESDPAVFMAHYDVVPADRTQWEKDPFSGAMENGTIWGRGTLDTKTTVYAIMEAAETLLSEGFRPRHDIYLAFSGDEEVWGASAPAMVDKLESRGIRPAFVLDEGGMVVRNAFQGISAPCALVCTGEKGFMSVEFTAESAGGHASSPPEHTAIGMLAQAVTCVENHPFPPRLTKPVAEMFNTLGRYSNITARLLFSNLWCFLPLLNFSGRKQGSQLSSLMRTTCAFTMMEGGSAPNVLPQKASVTANLRFLRGDTMESSLALLRQLVPKSVTVRKLYGSDPSSYSDTHCGAWEQLKTAIHQTWPGVIVSPSLMAPGSDSRHYSRISDKVYRFTPLDLSAEELATVHGINERIPVEKVVKAVEFYLRVMNRC